MRHVHLAAVLLSSLLLSSLLPGCGSGHPITPPSPADVEGLYTITQLHFTPLATGVQPANVLDTLVMANTSLELFGSGAALFRYKVEGEPSDIVSGEFDVSATQVRLRLQDPGGRLIRLLLEPTMTFDRLPDQSLRLEAQTVVNLAAFDPQRYASLTQVPGTLRVRLVRIGS